MYTYIGLPYVFMYRMSIGHMPDTIEYLLQLGDSHLCRVAGNTMWSHMACEFPVAVKAKLTLTAIH